MTAAGDDRRRPRHGGPPHDARRLLGKPQRPVRDQRAVPSGSVSPTVGLVRGNWEDEQLAEGRPCRPGSLGAGNRAVGEQGRDAGVDYGPAQSSGQRVSRATPRQGGKGRWGKLSAWTPGAGMLRTTAKEPSSPPISESKRPGVVCRKSCAPGGRASGRSNVAVHERRAILAFGLARHQPCERQARDEQR